MCALLYLTQFVNDPIALIGSGYNANIAVSTRAPSPEAVCCSSLTRLMICLCINNSNVECIADYTNSRPWMPKKLKRLCNKYPKLEHEEPKKNRDLL